MIFDKAGRASKHKDTGFVAWGRRPLFNLGGEMTIELLRQGLQVLNVGSFADAIASAGGAPLFSNPLKRTNSHTGIIERGTHL
jgi:hypothetical protein